MKLKIIKVESIGKNVFGDRLVDYTSYVIYRPFFFGLFRRYLRVYEKQWVPGSIKVAWKFSCDYATFFHTQVEAEAMIKDIIANPNKYYQKKYSKIVCAS